MEPFGKAVKRQNLRMVNRNRSYEKLDRQEGQLEGLSRRYCG
jgi:hypothetical protein